MSTTRLLVLLSLLSSASAWAQDSTTGAIRGTVKSGAGPVIGGTIVATSPALQGTQIAISDEGGAYEIPSLPPGEYLITVYYQDGEWTRKGIVIQIGKVARVNFKIKEDAEKGKTIVIKQRAPMLDQGSTKRGVTINEDYSRNIPTGQTFAGTLEAASGAQGDSYGVSFGGSTSPENVYIVNGLNTTDPLAGLIDSNLPNEFIYETEVITGGYQAEYGRATGAVVNVVTKTGSNEFHGQAYSYFTPGALRATPTKIQREGSSISRESDPVLNTSLGAEVGGPIIKDKVWFHVGVNPEFSFTDVNRVISSQVDANQDGVPDLDPGTGFTSTEEVARQVRKQSSRRVFFTGSTSYAVSPEHQGMMSFFGNPRSREAWVSLNGAPESGLVDIQDGSYDVSTKWTSKFLNNKHQIDGVLGYHIGRFDERPAYTFAGAGADGSRSTDRYDYELPLSAFESIGGCADGGAEDKYPMIGNCPVRFYRKGGPGFVEEQNSGRLAGQFSYTHRLRLGGHHVIKVGADFENNTLDSFRHYTGGAFYRHRANYTQIYRFYTVGATGSEMDRACGADLDADETPDATCSYKENGLNAKTRTFNLGGYLQDSWAILPNLTLNAGVRWEQQKLFTAEHVVGEISPTSGEPIPEEAFTLSNMIAPRLGIIYDWTEEGRSKLYVHGGRFYESIPMDINDRAYGGEVFDIQYIAPCRQVSVNGEAPTPCDISRDNELGHIALGGGESLVSPGLKAQYLDELVLGVEYEVLEDLTMGVAYIHRGLGRVIEDVSADGGETYVIANPGENDQGAIDALRLEAGRLEMQAANTPDPAQADALASRAEFLNLKAHNYEKVKDFDKPKRTYNAVEISAKKRFSKKFFVQGSYTYSKTKGNFPGLFSPDTGQLDPNLTSMYDLPDLMANRYGDLPQDKPHSLKVDGYYVLRGKKLGRFVFGGSARAASGRPHNVLGAHSVYGSGEAFVLPRGSSERSPFTTQFDTHIAYGRALGNGMSIEGFVDVFNLFNQQPEVHVDEEYTYDSVNPIVGGDGEDLRHLKALVDDKPTSALAEKNPNFGNVVSRQAPFAMRMGLRLLF